MVASVKVQLKSTMSSHSEVSKIVSLAFLGMLFLDGQAVDVALLDSEDKLAEVVVALFFVVVGLGVDSELAGAPIFPASSSSREGVDDSSADVCEDCCDEESPLRTPRLASTPNVTPSTASTATMATPIPAGCQCLGDLHVSRNHIHNRTFFLWAFFASAAGFSASANVNPSMLLAYDRALSP